MTKTILLLGTHGQENIGDDLLLDTFLDVISSRVEYQVDFIVNSYNPIDTLDRYSSLYNITTFHTIKDLLKLPLFIYKSDSIVFAGGSIIKELYSCVGRMKYSVFFMILGVVILSKFMRKRVYMSHIGTGPIGTKLGSMLSVFVFWFVDFASFRDAQSLSLVSRSLRKVDDRLLAADAVFAANLAVIRSNKESPVKTIALNLNYNIKDVDQWHVFEKKIVGVLKKMESNMPIRIICFPMQFGFSEYNDVATAKSFIERFKHEFHYIEYVQIQTYQELLELFSSVDLVIAERYHAIILALRSRAPVFGLCYDPKVSSLFSENDIVEWSSSVENVSVPDVAASCIDLLSDPTRHLLATTKVVEDLSLKSNIAFDKLCHNISIV